MTAADFGAVAHELADLVEALALHGQVAAEGVPKMQARPRQARRLLDDGQFLAEVVGLPALWATCESQTIWLSSGILIIRTDLRRRQSFLMPSPGYEPGKSVIGGHQERPTSSQSSLPGPLLERRCIKTQCRTGQVLSTSLSFTIVSGYTAIC